MLTIDDANTILEKYGETGFFYEIDLNKITDKSDGKEYYYDFCKISFNTYSQVGLMVWIEVLSSLKPHPLYIKKSDGSYPTINAMNLYDNDSFEIQMPNDGDLIIGMYISKTAIPDFDIDILWYRDSALFLPVSPLQIPVVNGEFDNKFYIDVIGSNISSYTIDGTAVTLQTDTKGSYLELPSATDCIVGTTGSSKSFPLYRVTFREFKSLPNLSIPTLYKGTPQEVKLYNEDTESYITDFQAYYQGRKLKDNIITLPPDCPTYVDIVIDIQDNNYPPARVKLKSKTRFYICHTTADAETAIANGIKAIQVQSSGVPHTIEEVLFEDMYVDSFMGRFKNCTFNNCTFYLRTLGSQYYYTQDRGGNVFNNCEITGPSNCKLVMTSPGTVFNNCTANGVIFEDYKMQFTGSITDCVLDKSLVISDGDITITDSEFTGEYGADYFPNFLYLTGTFEVKNNSFTMSGEWEEPAFNMCLIKSIDSFNPSVFINDNTFNLNIVYDDEPTDTFYYNIVDDDKIYARRLS